MHVEHRSQLKNQWGVGPVRQEDGRHDLGLRRGGLVAIWDKRASVNSFFWTASPLLTDVYVSVTH